MPLPFSQLSSKCLSRTADLIDCLRRKRLRSERREIRSNILYFLVYKGNVHTQVPLGNRLGRTCADDGFPISDTSRTLTLWPAWIHFDELSCRMLEFVLRFYRRHTFGRLNDLNRRVFIVSDLKSVSDFVLVGLDAMIRTQNVPVSIPICPLNIDI